MFSSSQLVLVNLLPIYLLRLFYSFLTQLNDQLQLFSHDFHRIFSFLSSSDFFIASSRFVACSAFVFASSSLEASSLPLLLLL